MMRLAPIRRTRLKACKSSEEGFILVSVMFILALLIIAMAVALPKISADIQRDREVETMHRGLQYRRAIQLYYRKFNRYPPSMDALVKTNEIRFLRKKYIDPTTKKEEWKPIMFGQNKTPLAMGFFGQPLGGMAMGAALGAGMGAGGMGAAGGMGLGNVMGTGAGNNSLFPSNTSTPASGTDPASGTTGGATGTTGTATGTTGTTDLNGNPTDPNAAQMGAGFGGAGIIGFSPTSPKQSILVYKKKNHYNEWEFTYSILSEQQGGMPIQQTPVNSPPGVGAPGVPVQAPGTNTPVTPTSPQQ